MTRNNIIYIPNIVFKDSFIHDNFRIKLLPISQLCLQQQGLKIVQIEKCPTVVNNLNLQYKKPQISFTLIYLFQLRQ